MIEARRLAKKQILHIAFQFDILHTLKPDQLNRVSPVSECGRETLSIANTDSVPLGDMTDDLHIGVIVLYLVDIVEAAAIDILVRKLV